MKLVVHETPEQTASGAAARISSLLAETVDGFSLGLAGGSTPSATYTALRGLTLDWRRVDAWLSDERWVPPNSERSNGRMAAVTLMEHVDARFHRPRWGDHIEAADSAAHYEATLRSIHADKQPDLILLGMGEDGHTASLFPASPALGEKRRWFVANRIPETGEQRLTATYPLLWRARFLMVLTTGEQKAPALREAIEHQAHPIGRIGEGDGTVEWYIDRAAASLLS